MLLLLLLHLSCIPSQMLLLKVTVALIRLISLKIAWCTGGLTCMYLEDNVLSNLLYRRTYNVPSDMYICAHSFYAS